MNNKASILVVDDEPDLLANISLALEAAGYQVITAGDGMEALETLETNPADLILADIAMPNMNGYQLYERIREKTQWAAIPFIFLTARKMDSDIRYGKEMGVDDYLTKPIRSADLLAVVRGKLRRAQQLEALGRRHTLEPGENTRGIVVGNLHIDPGQHRVWMKERPIKLSVKEFALLEYLAQHAGDVVAAEELIQVTHDLKTDFVEAGSLLRPLILSLRRKLGVPAGEIGCIENVRGIGYRLIAP
ncbi:MAG: response regulator transcription factor [Anaerolineae bacterium]|nr:response regulator transcription factor [Anaerolineae bacterium]